LFRNDVEIDVLIADIRHFFTSACPQQFMTEISGVGPNLLWNKSITNMKTDIRFKKSRGNDGIIAADVVEYVGTV
jgi:hypothetical protein